MCKHWVGLAKFSIFIYSILNNYDSLKLEQIPEHWSRFPELAQIKTSRTKGSGFWYPTQCKGNDLVTLHKCAK